MKSRIRVLLAIASLISFGLLVGTAGGDPASPKNPPGKNKAVHIESAAPSSGKFNTQIDITDVFGHDLPSRVELRNAKNEKISTFEVPKGHSNVQAPVGSYKAYVYVYWQQVPVLVDVQDLVVKNAEVAYVLLNLEEGSGEHSLFDFDKDHDLALDRVEIKCGTNPEDASSIPGKETLPFNNKVIEKKEGWYRGELHARSTYGGVGKESVSQLVKRAEKLGLDFLAITDRNTMDACKDPGFKSDSVALIPAMEWGSDKKGVALLYGPRTFPEFVDSVPQAQALVSLVQAQGGFFAIAHPCFPTAPWLWGLSYVNGIEIWCRDWNAVPPLALEQLPENLKARDRKKNGKLVQSIAFAAATEDLSANGQASVFYDCELVRGLKAAVIAGSRTSTAEVPMAQPVTYVYAIEKSARGIINGMRRGRTFVSCGLDGPRIGFTADVLKDKVVDASFGGIIPLGVPTEFAVTADHVKGKEVQVLVNGRVFISKNADKDAVGFTFPDTPERYTDYRIRVVGKREKVRGAAKPEEEGFGSVEVYAISSPIYAEDIDIADITHNKELKEFQKQRMKEEQKHTRAMMKKDTNANMPNDANVREVMPKWTFTVK